MLGLHGLLAMLGLLGLLGLHGLHVLLELLGLFGLRDAAGRCQGPLARDRAELRQPAWAAVDRGI